MLLRSITIHAGCAIFSTIIPQVWQNNLVGSLQNLHLCSTSNFESHILQDLFCMILNRKIDLKIMLKLETAN